MTKRIAREEQMDGSGGKLRLPKPPTTNTLYVNRPGRGRVKADRYRTWICAAQSYLIGQPRWRVEQPCVLDLTVKKSGRIKEDISNRIKAVEDFLVDQGYLADDRLVIEVRARWGNVDGCEVRMWGIVRGGGDDQEI